MSLLDVQEDIDEFTTISFPVLADEIVTDYLGGKFIPLVSHPGSVFIVLAESYTQTVKRMILNTLNLWPFLANFVVLHVLVALIIWWLVSSSYILMDLLSTHNSNFYHLSQSEPSRYFKLFFLSCVILVITFQLISISASCDDVTTEYASVQKISH